MTDKNKELEAKLLDVNKLSDDQLAEIRSQVMREDVLRNRKKASELRKLVIIKDFNDPRVKPFSRNAIYNVYNEKTNTEVTMHGAYIEGFIAVDDEKFLNFESKSYGSKITMDGKEITFKHYEHKGE